MRAKVEEGAELRLTIPTKKDWRIAFFSVWMIGWYFGETSVGSEIVRDIAKGEWPSLFDLGWITMWTFFGVYFTGWIIWRLLGTEILTVGSGRLCLRKEIAGVGYTREFELPEVRTLRFRPEYRVGKRYHENEIQFDYGAKTYAFATGSDPAEAEQLMELIAKWAPHLRFERAVEQVNPPSTQRLGLS